MLKSRLFLLTCLALAAAAISTTAQTTGKNPVIIIPGVTGSNLINPKTGKAAWFNARREKDDDMRLPMTSATLSRNRDGLEARDIIRKIEVPILPDVQVYQTLIDALIARGYTEGDWSKPQAADVFYVFPYDWRRDNVESAQLLIRRMLAVKQAVKRPDLKFDILAHSMGGLIARYAAMYGAADLPGAAPVPTWAGAAHINKLMMFGTPNEGAANAFDALLNGSPIIGGRNLPFVDDFRPEDVMTSPAAFQLLPHQSTARFLDENLQPIKIDIYNIETWDKYGWGALNDPKFLGKLKDASRLAVKNREIKPVRPNSKANFDDRLTARTTYAQARAYFAAALKRAKLFQLALDAPAKNTTVQLYAYGGNCRPTLDAIVLLRDAKKDKWITLVDARDIKTSGGKEIKKETVKAAMFANGDGRVTQRSLLGETVLADGSAPDVKSILTLKTSFFACGLHTSLFIEKQIEDSFLSTLVVGDQKQP
ncbi:MAG: esterase/lipase family protein [Pyrinomonadaceae bacterium]